MGGSISVVIRHEDGKIEKMTRWTNNLTYWLFRDEMKTNPAKVIKEYSKVKSDYNSGKSYLAPYDYGLVVIDLQKNIILNKNEYTSLDHQMVFLSSFMNIGFRCINYKVKDGAIPFIDIAKLRTEALKNYKSFEPLYKTENRSVDDIVNSELAEIKIFYDYFMGGNLYMSKKRYEDFYNRLASKKDRETQAQIYQRFGSAKKRTVSDWEFLLKSLEKVRFGICLDTKIGKFKVLDYNNKSYLSFYKKIKELGFELTAKEEKMWLEEIKGND